MKALMVGLTSWAASEDQLADFIIDEDEQGVREGAEPPVGPGKHTKAGNEKLIQRPGREPRTCGRRGPGIERIQRRGLGSFTHLRGYILRATSMPGQ